MNYPQMEASAERRDWLALLARAARGARGGARRCPRRRAVATLPLAALRMQGGLHIPASTGVSLDVARGECVVLVGPSGAGKSTLLRCLYGNYLVSAGSVQVRADTETRGYLRLTGAAPHEVMRLRRNVIGYVSQFLRVIPRVSTLDLVAEPLIVRGVGTHDARSRASELLAQLNIPARLWPLAPATFSGGEQQRVNIARGLIAGHPVLLLDEPTASLDTANRDVVAGLIVAARERGAAIVGIFHDGEPRSKVATRVLELTPVAMPVAA
jgi:alpha-D-ribose 1-methylphosphonate 5-triphosphate synthase subunit PhnL